MIDYRYVYVLRRRNGQCKIGIAKDTSVRIKSIRKSTENNTIKLYTKIKVPFALKLEKWLHNRYEHLQEDYEGSGYTEWFNLSFLNRWAIVAIFWLIAFLKLLFWGVFLALIFFWLYIISA